ncbi:MFS general substrate transporter [Cutaneotrichosporon oleaginosum]|uniref:MFS general substrate transporter n=1 Tax=Cutaneotrichosporon oleaginosum TaxID=879819 RepID=A0A0J0XW52_9TREE|nr:MFS general substrate transporter [Cutaneotrichosporon oleaginosum]KLT45268.1 MFS general substrate transporter [Cutaneotrichosporon oleaginosum]TXT14903.1 hypothetical protein COLE_01096 [Cutaneotrichosporon oleaginosum]
MGRAPLLDPPVDVSDSDSEDEYESDDEAPARRGWLVFLGIALAAYIYSLDGMTTYQYLSFATSAVRHHSSAGTIGTVQAIIIAVGKPFMAKIADVCGRGEAFLVVATLYLIGYLTIAAAGSISTIAVGNVFYAFGYTGLQILLQIVIADMTSLRWRGLVGGLVSAPFLINIFVSAEIASRVLPDWRRGYVQFALVVPLMLAPLIIALLSQKRERLRPQHNLGTALRAAAAEMDFVGLVLVAASLALILVPLGIVPADNNNWEHTTLIGMGLIGLLLFAAFLAYEWRVPAHPVFPMRWLRRTPILSACLIGFFDFTSFYLQYTYLYSFVLVTEDWGLKTVAYFVYTHAFSITVFGIVAGAIMYATRRFKWMLFAGLIVRLLGVGIMLRARSAEGSTFELVLCQVLQGLGGGFAGIATQVGAQAAVGTADIATVTAMTLLLSEVGNSVGSAAATGIWNTYMPRDLAEHVPTTNQTLLDELFGSITDIVEYPIDDPIRLGAIEAYRSVMHRLVSWAIAIAVIPPIVCLFLTKDVRLSNARAVAGLDEEPTTPVRRIRRQSSRMSRIASRRSLRTDGTATPDELEHLVPRTRTPEYV